MLDSLLNNPDDELSPLTAPLLEWWLRALPRHDVRATGDAVVIEGLRRVFSAAEMLEDCGGDEARALWLELPCGSYQEFAGQFDEDDTPMDEQEWNDDYPSGTGWFHVVVTRYRSSIGLAINDQPLTVTSDEQLGIPIEHWPDPRLRQVVSWLEGSIPDAVDSVRTGRYNDHVAQSLPYRKRLGKIRRASWWTISPASKEWHLGDFSADEADRLYETIAQRVHGMRKERLPEMTVDAFLSACQIGYRATRADGFDTLTARELYQRHADGRHDGLLDLDPTSPEAFVAWNDSGFKGGHPWEILRGGNSTHVSLQVCHDDAGWWFIVAGASAGRSVESARIFLALVATGLPVELVQGSNIATMLIGADDIGIVPDYIFPRYCQSLFPGENLNDFMNLPHDLSDQTVARAYWYPVPLVRPRESSDIEP